jgi:undecaprenyl-diphosphatase
VIEALQAFDLALLRWLTPLHHPWLDRVMVWASVSGGAGLIWLLLGLVAFTRPRHRAAAWRVLLTVGLAYALVDGVIKPLVARERPSILASAPPRDVPPLPRTFSFPSGHAASTFGAAVAVSRMWPQARLVWWIVALLIGYSRIYLAHHYPLDVGGGALLGIAVAFWVLGGRHGATDGSTLPNPLPHGVVLRP